MPPRILASGPLGQNPVGANIESLYGLGRQATELYRFVRNFATLARLSFEQFSTENS